MAVECAFNLANAIVTLAGVGLGGVIGFLSARRVSDRTSQATAAAKLRAAFAPALALIYIARKHDTDDKPLVSTEIKAWLRDHGAAIEEFRPFVCDSRRPAYQEAWEKYRKYAAQSEFSTAGEEWAWGAEEGEILESNINAILRFAEN